MAVTALFAPRLAEADAELASAQAGLLLPAPTLPAQGGDAGTDPRAPRLSRAGSWGREDEHRFLSALGW